MNDSRKHRWMFLLLAIASLFGTNEALAQSNSAASKRSFATLLARRAVVIAPQPGRPTTVNPFRFIAKPVSPVHGISAATPVVPPPGFWFWWLLWRLEHRFPPFFLEDRFPPFFDDFRR